MVDVTGTMKEIEKHLEEMKKDGHIEDYEIELADSEGKYKTWTLWTW